MKLVHVTPAHYQYLYRLLEMRPSYSNISHREMPTYEEHVNFLNSSSYRGHWIIMSEAAPVGQIYVTKHNEVGIQIEPTYQHNGAGTWALAQIIDTYKGERLLANISPLNEPSQAFFEKHGFRLIQYTYEL